MDMPREKTLRSHLKCLVRCISKIVSFFCISKSKTLIALHFILHRSKQCCFICPLFDQEIQATWYEKLHEWEDALVAYDKKIDMNKEDPELILGRMRCLEALGEWYVIMYTWSLTSELPFSF